MSGLAERLLAHGSSMDCPVIDVHGHMGQFAGIFFPYAGPAQMLARMDRAGVRTVLFSHHFALCSPEAPFRVTEEPVEAHPGRMLAYMVIHPRDRGGTRRNLARVLERPDVYAGLKLHPSMHSEALDGEAYAEALAFADGRGMPVLCHTWGEGQPCGWRNVEAVLRRYPSVPFIMGHSCYGCWEEAGRLAADYPNAYSDLCAVLNLRNGGLRALLDRAGPAKLLFGTDFPWFSHHYYLAALLEAGLDEESLRMILYRNACALFRL